MRSICEVSRSSHAVNEGAPLKAEQKLRGPAGGSAGRGEAAIGGGFVMVLPFVTAEGGV
jgi:hypothetical protein